MSEFIGSRISLVSRSDIRYVGTLHEINSETSTVALENVTSFGTEGRKANPEEEIPPSDSVYEYIVFRGSDVKDLRIEEAPAPKETKPPQVPNDPAILGSGARPQQATPQNQQNVGSAQAGPPASAQQPGQPPHGGPPFGQYPPQYYPPPGGWGRAGPGPGYPGMPYGAPPGWYPPPGQGFPPAPFTPYGYPPGPPGPPGAQFPQGAGPKPAPIGQGANKQQASGSSNVPSTDKQPENKGPAKPAAELTAAPAKETSAQPAQAKPSAAGQPTGALNNASTAAPQAAPTGPKAAIRVQPAVPLPSTAAGKTQQQASTNPSSAAATVASSLKDATEAATAAVAAAMAKLPPINGQSNGNPVDNLAQKVSELKTNDSTRAPRQPGAGGFAERGRGRGRGRAEVRKVEVPATDFDFESANAKFSKEDLVKEAIAGGTLSENQDTATSETNGDAGKPTVPTSGYNKSTSFFDNISSEAKERAEGGSSRPGGREWRGEEQRKNLETFGQGSVDNGFRGGFRGRGRGRGYRGRGYIGHPGQGGRARGGGYRGGRGDAQTTIQ
ncbi:Scd6-like Sm domain-containing protein [Xylogone sp. PMI_703]|nr:Scd6-like Sm domain-containing protein [Xylogone sp. PMI_703]